MTERPIPKEPMKPLIRTALLSLAILAFHTGANADALHDHPGFWVGDVTMPDGKNLKIGAELFTRADGSAWASVAWPEQGAVEIPVRAIRDASSDSFLLDLGQASLKLTWTGDRFRGEWLRGGRTLHAELKQVSAYPRPVRPQTPKAPFPYHDETLAIQSKDGVVLGATLSVPATPARPNAVVLIAGSGPQSRHSDDFGHPMFDVLADYLARQGVAVLRYDKRGISRSTGDYAGHTAAGLADDAYAAAMTLKRSGKFARVGLVGHSEGSQIAAAVLAAHPEAADLIVSLAGVGLRGLDTMLLQDRQFALDNGATPEELERLMPYVRRFYDTVLSTPDGAPRSAALKALYAGLPAADRALVDARHMDAGTLSPQMASEPFLPVLLRTDPRTHWRAVRAPALVLHGSLDHQVAAEEDVAGIVAALKAGGNTWVEAAILPGLNHAFQTARTGTVDEYATIEETMAPAAMQKIADFANTDVPSSNTRH
jgi:pimeloyl-ACP methyl ester carboxylesterase